MIVLPLFCINVVHGTRTKLNSNLKCYYIDLVASALQYSQYYNKYDSVNKSKLMGTLEN